MDATRRVLIIRPFKSRSIGTGQTPARALRARARTGWRICLANARPRPDHHRGSRRAPRTPEWLRIADPPAQQQDPQDLRHSLPARRLRQRKRGRSPPGEGTQGHRFHHPQHEATEVIDSIGRLGNWDPTLSLTTPYCRTGQRSSRIAVTAPADRAKTTALRLAYSLMTPSPPILIHACLKPSHSKNRSAFCASDWTTMPKLTGSVSATKLPRRLPHAWHRVLKDKIGTRRPHRLVKTIRFVIVSVTAAMQAVTAFARRKIAGFANSQVTIAGKSCNLKVSAGIVSTTPDDNTTADAPDIALPKNVWVKRSAEGADVVSDDIDPGAHLDAQYFTDLGRLLLPANRHT